MSMSKSVTTGLVILLVLHGLVHLMGFVAYWPLQEVPELAYKTVFLGGALELGETGTRLYSVLWVLAAAGFVAAGVAVLAGRTWGRALLLAVTLLSLALTVLDWSAAFRGVIINIVILAILLFGPQLSRRFRQTGR